MKAATIIVAWIAIQVPAAFGLLLFEAMMRHGLEKKKR